MSALARIAQGGLKIETVEGTYETLAAADFSRNTKESSFNASATRYQRGLKRAALTKLKDLVGGKIGEISFKEEMVGGGASTDAPWFATLQACGMQKTALKIITVGSITGGSFAAGDTISASSGTHTGRVAWTGTVGGAVKIVYEPILGTFVDTDTVTNGTATGTQSGAAAAAGYSHRFMSEDGSQTPPSASVEYRDGIYTERLVGARGDFTLMLNWGEVPLLDVKFRGPRQIKDVDGTPLDQGLVSSVTSGGTPSAVLGDVGYPLRFDAWEGVFTQASLKCGNTLTDRKTLSQAGVIGYVTQGYHSGYMPTRITDRRCEFTVDPEAPAESTKSLMKNWHANADMVLHIQAGKLLASGDKSICVNGPRCSLAQDSFSETDRDGILALSLTALLTGVSNDDDELYIDHVCIP
jgi:hypothetical protein